MQATCRFDQQSEKWNVGFGLSPVSAAQLLANEFPEIPQWMVWSMKFDPAESAIRSMLGEGISNRGKVGAWSWERVPCSYGSVGFWSSRLENPHLGVCWVGMIRVTGAKGESFLVTVPHRIRYPIGKRTPSGIGVATVGKMLEYGTPKRQPMPWMRPAFHAKKDEAAKVMADEVLKGIARLEKKLART